MENSPHLTRTPLPTALPPLKELDLHARYYSSRTGGDFFDAVATGPYVVFFLTDIAGTRDLPTPSPPPRRTPFAAASPSSSPPKSST